jgi:hypothetical protein
MSVLDMLIVLAALVLAAVHAMQIATILSGALAVRRERRFDYPALRQAAAGAGELPGISALVAAPDAADAAERLVDALFDQRYPDLEVILVVDGESSRAFDDWSARGVLRHSDPPPRGAIPTEHVRAVFTVGDHDTLLIVDKRGRDLADALNAGLNLASRPLVLSMAPGASPGPNGLVEAALPFALDPSTTVSWPAPAAMDLTAAAEPAGLVAGVGAVRRARRRLESLSANTTASTLAPFTLALFRREALVRQGGFEPYAPNPEAALLARLDAPRIAQPGEARILAPKPAGWRTLASDAALDTPFARGAALVESVGWILVLAGLALGAATSVAALLFVSVSLGLGLGVSLTTVLVEVLDGRDAPALTTVVRYAFFSVLEQLGPRQLAALTRLRTWLAPSRQAAPA